MMMGKGITWQAKGTRSPAAAVDKKSRVSLQVRQRRRDKTRLEVTRAGGRCEGSDREIDGEYGRKDIGINANHRHIAIVAIAAVHRKI